MLTELKFDLHIFAFRSINTDRVKRRSWKTIAGDFQLQDGGPASIKDVQQYYNWLATDYIPKRFVERTQDERPVLRVIEGGRK